MNCLYRTIIVSESVAPNFTRTNFVFAETELARPNLCDFDTFIGNLSFIEGQTKGTLFSFINFFIPSRTSKYGRTGIDMYEKLPAGLKYTTFFSRSYKKYYNFARGRSFNCGQG